MYSFMSHMIFNHLHKLHMVIKVCTIIYNIHTWGIQNDTQMMKNRSSNANYFAKFLLNSLPHKYHDHPWEQLFLNHARYFTDN